MLRRYKKCPAQQGAQQLNTHPHRDLTETFGAVDQKIYDTDAAL